MVRFSRRLSMLLCLATGVARAQSPVPPPSDASASEIDTIRVIGVARPFSRFPGAATVIDTETLRDGQRQTNVSEALQRVPGFTALDRQNYAQDLQIQSRGFGARSTFGIRGIRLIVDDIPASAADGQGQAAMFSLSSLDRIDVLRGPLALLYGNAAGGAIVGYTELNAPPGIEADAWVGSHAARRAAVRADVGAFESDWRMRAGASVFAADGARVHSAARREQFNTVAEWTPREGDSLRMVANVLRQPLAQDPLGIDRATYRRDPQSTDPAAARFDTRKTIADDQIGLRWRGARANGEWWLGGYAGRRDVEQFLAVPIAAQRAASSAGGVIDLRRDSRGVDAGRRWRGERGGIAIGVEATTLHEDRRGFENFVGDDPTTATLGVRGRLRRDEDNRVDAVDGFAVADYRIAQDWTVVVGARRSWLRFESEDRYLLNGDDSGERRETGDAWSVGFVRAFERGEWYASLGRGFETPTLTESAFRPDGGAGFNRDLRNARHHAWETGGRWRSAYDAHRFDVALYRIDGRDEIVPALNRGGRASFANAGATRRFGIEFGASGTLTEQWSYVVAASWIDARFAQNYRFRVAAGASLETREVEAGARIPGIPRADLFAELSWRSRDGRWRSALELRALGSIVVDDRNTDRAAGRARFAWRGQWSPRANSPWQLYARIDHIADDAQIGSVIVNEANGRYFEPAAGREYTFGVRWRFEP
jgi:iron complex outermembrane recepter protein